ncbi:Biopterin-dependent aromatic amino acid hydroxylase [Ancylostoma ceylanicum]|nr:Biopterin-dependent aromatic amino acid hydroxylase [Ancylostoma ceylanicum]
MPSYDTWSEVVSAGYHSPETQPPRCCSGDARRARTTLERLYCHERAHDKTPTETMTTQNANESPRHPRRFSLVHQASYETLLHAGVRRQNTQKHREQLREITRGEQILQQLNDEGVELIWAADKGSIAFTAVLSSSGDLATFVAEVIKAFGSSKIRVSHLETRQEKSGNGWDLLADCDATKEQLISAAASLTQQHVDLTGFALYKKNAMEEVPWFPRHISELDKCSHCITKYDPTTDPRHPGHGDAAYIARRQFLNDHALEYRHGDPIPIVEYTEEEHATWKEVYEKLRGLHETHTCLAYRKNLKLLEDAGVLTSERIPQIRDVNKYLQKRTGFILRPCSGLLSARDFLASLAFRVFQTTTYLRHSGKPHHSPEPDLIHELLGHVPMFADPMVAQMSQDIGLMSLGASDEQIEKLATVYWFIIEFGLCREEGKLKAIGAGLISAYGELMHACSDKPEHRDFDPVTTAVQKYEDSDYQPLYFVAQSIQDALTKLRQYALSMERPFAVIYDPFTRSVETVRSISDLEPAFSRFRMEFSATTHAFDKLNLNKSSK